MNKRLMANPQEKEASVEMWAKDNDRQFIKKEIQTNVNVNKHKPQRYHGSAIQNHNETGKN